MRTLLTVAAFVLGIIVLMVVGGGLLVLAAYGVGLLLNLVLHLEPFQATLLSLAGFCACGWLANQVWSALMASPPFRPDEYDEDEYDEDDEYYDDEEDDEDDEPVIYPGIPRWRQPIKPVDFSNVKPDDRCPCGSGRKYKNCHGTKNKNR